MGLIDTCPPGNRLTAKIKQAPVSGHNRDNAFSQLNAYDALHRLVGTEVGVLSTSPPAITSPLREDAWDLDLLGNWAADGTGAGRRSLGNLDGSGHPWKADDADGDPDDLAWRHDPNYRNEAQSLFEDNDDWPSPRTIDTEYDAAGNLTFDGEYFYQYDAWGRLMQVNFATRGTGGAIELGHFVKGHAYDGLGRLIRTSRRIRSPVRA